jgi:activator of Hsp90 ATPase-like protein
MTAAREPARGQVVTALRPPVRQSTLVRCGAGQTFLSFVTTIGAWWPVRPFSAGEDRVRAVTVEPRQGGQVYETWDDGTVVDWGTVVGWEPPRRFVMTWIGTPAPTEVEFTFAALGPALTRVTVEHRGWDALTDEQLAEDCALPGGYHSGAYSDGWAAILACMAGAIGEADESARITDRGAQVTGIAGGTSR